MNPEKWIGIIILCLIGLCVSGCENDGQVESSAAPAYGLICTVTEASTDPDNDPILYTYAWAGEEEEPLLITVTAELSAKLPVELVSYGQVLTCCVTPSDGEHDGPPGCAEYGVGWPPEVTSWAIAATHGIVEIVSPITDDYVECRSCGIRCLVVTFSEALSPSSVDPGAILIIGTTSGDVSSMIESIALAADLMIMHIMFSGMLPDQDGYTVTLPMTLCDTVGNPLSGDHDIELVSLRGDTNSNLTVDVGDMLAVKAHEGETINTSTARYDMDSNGQIEQADMLIVRGFIPR